MFTFAQMPVWPRFWIFKMAAVKKNFRISQPLIDIETLYQMLILCFQAQGIQK